MAGILFFLFFMVKWVYLILRERWRLIIYASLSEALRVCVGVIMLETNAAVWPRVVSSFHAMQCFGRLLILGWKRYLCSTVDMALVWTMCVWILQVCSWIELRTNSTGHIRWQWGMAGKIKGCRWRFCRLLSLWIFLEVQSTSREVARGRVIYSVAIFTKEIRSGR